MNLLVDQPIINSPFKEPESHWLYEQGQAGDHEFAPAGGVLFQSQMARQ